MSNDKFEDYTNLGLKILIGIILSLGVGGVIGALVAEINTYGLLEGLKSVGMTILGLVIFILFTMVYGSILYLLGRSAKWLQSKLGKKL